jgi:hypothetical protein
MMRGSRIFWIIVVVAVAAAIALAAALKHQQTVRLQKQHQRTIGPIPATR